MKTLFTRIIISTILALWSCMGIAGDTHIRVILDTSKSMLANDPNNLSVLSVLLLRDLSDLVLEHPPAGKDSFKVLTFDENYYSGPDGKYWNSGPVPKSNAPMIILGPGTPGRTNYVNKIQSVKRNALDTYFTPALNRTIDDLNTLGNVKDDSRTIILVTDGEPDGSQDETYFQAIADNLESSNIRLFVLAFGPGSLSSATKKIEPLTTAKTGQIVGEIHQVSNSTGLIRKMLEIFANRFNYAISPARRAVDGINLALASTTGSHSGRTMVVTSVDSTSIPKFNLDSPPGGTRNRTATWDGQSFSPNKSKGSSYQAKVYDNVSSGNYVYRTPSSLPTSAQVSILKPVDFQIDVIDSETSTAPIYSVIAGKSILPVFVTGRAGAKPGSTDLLHFRELDSKGNPLGPGSPNRAAKISTSKTSKVGAFYDIEVEYPTGKPANEKYKAQLYLATHRGDPKNPTGKKTHPITVYPVLGLSPEPGLIDINQGVQLSEYQTGCAMFELEKKKGHFLEEITKGTMQVSLSLPGAANPSLLNNELNRATFTLNGQPIGFPNFGGSKWIFPSNKFTSLEAIETGPDGTGYELCVTLGFPTQSNPIQPVEFNIDFHLTHPPYNRPHGLNQSFKTITSALVSIQVKASDASWVNWLWLLLVPLGLIWLFRYVPKIEEDLRYTITGRDEEFLDQHEFGAPGPLRTSLRLIAPRSIRNPAGDEILGWIKPVYEELYEVKLDKSLAHWENDNFEKTGSGRNGYRLIEVNSPHSIMVKGQPRVLILKYSEDVA